MSVLGLRPYGDTGVLVDVADTAAALGLRAALALAPPPGLVDMVPAAQSLLLRVRPGTDLATVAAAVRAIGPHAAGADTGADTGADPVGGCVDIPVVYDGPDLDEVSTMTGLSAREVVAAHTGQSWTVAFAGFAPGFGYLRAPDPRLTVARRTVPRTAVPAGAVALAGEYSGVYPRPSPGGWQIIGRTDREMWNLDRDPPALLVPGAVVRFRECAP